MTEINQFQCEIAADMAHVAMRHGAWSHTITLADYPRWLAMYRALRDRQQGRFAKFYAQPVQALEAIAAKVKECGA